MEKSSSSSSKERIGYFDLLKGIGILLVVWGHCIQYGNGGEFLVEDAYFDNGLFQFIYSFHMPLFMFVSGYLFFFSLQRHSAGGVVASKFRTLVVPALTYAVLEFIVSRYWLRTSSILNFIAYMFTPMWFLWSVFYSSIVVLAVNKWLGDKFIVHAVLMMLTFVTPDAFDFNISLYKWTYFYFVAGYYINRNIGCLRQYSKYAPLAFVCVAILFLAMFQLYDRNIFIYTTGMDICHSEPVCAQLYYDVFRIVIGFLGTFFVCLLALLSKKAFNRFAALTRVITALGRNSLGIYFFQTFLVGRLLSRLTKDFTYSVPIPICETVIILTVCMLCIYVAKRFRITRMLVLGMRA